MKYQDIEPYFGERVAVQFASPLVLVDYGGEVVSTDSRIPILAPMIEEQPLPQGGKVQRLATSPILPVCMLHSVRQGTPEMSVQTGVVISYVGPSSARLEVVVDADSIWAITRLGEKPVKNESPILQS